MTVEVLECAGLQGSSHPEVQIRGDLNRGVAVTADSERDKAFIYGAGTHGRERPDGG